MSWATTTKPYREAQAIQALLLRDLEDPDTSPAARAQLARAWETIEERKRILRGRPLPGHLRPEAPKPKRKPVPTEPLEE